MYCAETGSLEVAFVDVGSVRVYGLRQIRPGRRMSTFGLNFNAVEYREVAALSDKEFRALIESACRFNSTRDPQFAIGDEYKDLFRFLKRPAGGRNKRHDRDALWSRFNGI